MRTLTYALKHDRFRQTADIQRWHLRLVWSAAKKRSENMRFIFCLPQFSAGTLFDTQNAKHW